jgi:hypothetical protein
LSKILGSKVSLITLIVLTIKVITISIDEKMALGNIYRQWFWHTLKQEYVYLRPVGSEWKDAAQRLV